MVDLTTLTPDDLQETFDLLDDADARLEYVLDLARSLPPYPDELRTDGARVPGCMSQVWLAPKPPANGETNGAMSFYIDSDAHIVKGVAAVMVVLFAGRTPDEILAFDADGALKRLHMDEYLSPNRRNGMASMVSAIKAMAARAKAA